MEKTTRKKIIISLIYLIVFSLITWWIYEMVKPEETCFDKTKNQNEEDVDCGGVCTPCKRIVASELTVGEKGFFGSGIEGKYDFWGEVANPNNTFGAQSFHYEIFFKDAGGSVVGQESGDNFILPGEKKYIIETNIVAQNPSLAEIVISNAKWIEFNDYYEKPQLKIVNKTYSEISSGAGFFEARGLLKNESPFDFSLIRVKILLRDGNGRVVALNSTEMRTVKSQEEREFRASWPTRFSGEVQSVDAQAEVNVFDSETFLKRYFKDQDFQKY